MDLGKQLQLARLGDFATLQQAWTRRGASRAEILKRTKAAVQVCGRARTPHHRACSHAHAYTPLRVCMDGIEAAVQACVWLLCLGCCWGFGRRVWN